MTDLTLYGDSFWISPYVFSCFVGLREKGLAFSHVEVSLSARAQHAPSYRDRAITGKVPALAHGDFWLTESSAIIEYLDDVFPGPRLLPREPRDRARARQVMAWIRSDLMALREERPTTTMFYERATSSLSPAGVAAAETLLRVATALIPTGGTQLFGAWSIADADLAFMLHRLILNDHPVPGPIRAYADAQWQRPSVRAWVEHQRRPLEPY
jgi:glutathione S-transferase